MKTIMLNSTAARRARHALSWCSIIGLLAVAPAAWAVDPTLAEMLELGIYSEETKGDLDAAMRLYEQIVAEAEANQELTAQAQFRLAMCHHKQGDFAAATAAFETLVRDFPNQGDLVSLANEYLAAGAALLPAPWADGEELQFNVRFPTGVKIGAARYGVQSDEIDGRKFWRFSSQLFAGVQQWSSVEVDADTFKPMSCRWKHSLIGEAVTVYTGSTADVKVKGTDEVKHVDLEGPVYDNEQAIQLMRRLPLADGYSTTLKVLTGLGGGNIISVPVEVSGPVTVSVPAGTFACHKATLKVGPSEQIFWYSTDKHRYLVKFEAGSVVVELARINQTTDDVPVHYRDEAFGFTLTAPAGWMFDRQETADVADRTNLLLLDPAGMAVMKVNVRSFERVSPPANEAPRAWAEHEIAEGRKQMRRFDVRADSWRELTVAGQPAVSFVGDIDQRQKPEVIVGVYSFIDGNAVEFYFTIAPDDYDAFRPQFDAIVSAYEGR